jgi:hypothetical protein
MTLYAIAPTRAYKLTNGDTVHARCADPYSLRLGNTGAFMREVRAYHSESATGPEVARCAMCGKPVRGMARASLRGVQVERAL